MPARCLDKYPEESFIFRELIEARLNKIYEQEEAGLQSLPMDTCGHPWKLHQIIQELPEQQDSLCAIAIISCNADSCGDFFCILQDVDMCQGIDS